MSKSITDGLVFTPAPFAEGLNNWSRGDGRSNGNSYASASNAALIPADQDFVTALEILKEDTTTLIRHRGETPILAGCYLQVTAKIKVMSGNFPDVAISALPMSNNGSIVNGLDQTAPQVTLQNYGQVVEVKAIIGTGQRGGVDLAWNDEVRKAHIGLTLTGPNGGVIRVDDLQVEDITGAYLRDMLDWVDVRDYGAKGDGSTDDSAAFEAADQAAGSRGVLVPEGLYRLREDVTMQAPCRFVGTVTMPADKRLALLQNFELNSYIDAFGDEVLGFKKAVQVLFNFSDHDSLNMNGRRIELTEPIDIAEAVQNRTTYANRRVIKNGQFNCLPSSGWDTIERTSTATYDVNNPTRLSGVSNISNIPVGSLVTAATGVGREVYVAGKSESQNILYLSKPLYGAPASQLYTFKRFQYALDFSGFQNLQRFVLSDIELLMAGNASGILLPADGLIFQVKDSFFTAPKDRGLTSHAEGCQGLLLDRNQFLSAEQPLDVNDRTSIGFNVNRNDAKIRDNRGVMFKHWGIMGGTGHVITGNHFFQGDTQSNTARSAGLVLTETNVKSIFSCNYVDNCFLEWGNEHDHKPEFQSEFSFGGLSITNNIFMSSNVASWYRPLHVKPYGAGHYLNGVTITGNVFKHINGEALERVDLVDTTFAGLATQRFNDVKVLGNTFHGVNKRMKNPVTRRHTENTANSTWRMDCSDAMPFGGQARYVASVLPDGVLRNGSNVMKFHTCYSDGQKGSGGQSVDIIWPESLRGTANVTVFCDTPD